jgi:alpha-galactosidase
MKKLLLFLLCISSTGLVRAQVPGAIIIRSKNTQLVFSVGVNKRLYQNYLGKISNEKTVPKPYQIEAYATAGMDFEFEPAIRVVHADGNPSLELKYQSYNSKQLENGTTQTDIILKDEVYPVTVTLHFISYPEQDVIKTWTDVKNNGSKTITLTNYASSMLHFNASKYWLTQFHGDWAKEMYMQEHQLTSGSKVIDSRLGTRASKFQSPNFMLSTGDEPAGENTGELIAGSLSWTGNFRFSFEIDHKNQLHVLAGINNYASDYYLEAGKVFTTPDFIFTYSKTGKGQASRNLHAWARKYAVLDGEKPRLTLLNNWEATGMKFDQAKLVSLFDDAKKLGVDMFLLDDGWFGNKYPRDDDNTSLGDWQADRKKLPDGIPYLVQEATKKDLKFGIWIEPEMVNPKSELYEKHPDWVLKLPNRTESYQRNQLVLDLTNPKVQEFVYKIVDDLFTQNPALAYIKWDCNRTMTNAYSAYLKNKQSHLYIDYTRGFYKVMERVRAKYPHVPIMLCSGGGGRADYGALKYFTEFWPSDNTDGMERIFIQWGYSYFFPANTISAHVTDWGTQSIKFRTDVAMMGKLGYDINMAKLTETEQSFSKAAVANYKRLSDVIWFGNLYRLASPYAGNRAVLMYVDTNKRRSVLFSYILQNRYREDFELVKLEGLDAGKSYRIKETNLMPGVKSALACHNKVFAGSYLMDVGIQVSNTSSQNSAFSSVVLEIMEE